MHCNHNKTPDYNLFPNFPSLLATPNINALLTTPLSSPHARATAPPIMSNFHPFPCNVFDTSCTSSSVSVEGNPNVLEKPAGTFVLMLAINALLDSGALDFRSIV